MRDRPFSTELKRNEFTQRLMNLWSSLSKAQSLIAFKAEIDHFWISAGKSESHDLVSLISHNNKEGHLAIESILASEHYEQNHSTAYFIATFSILFWSLTVGKMP